MELLLSVTTNQNDQYHEGDGYKVKEKEQKIGSIKKYRSDPKLRPHLYFELVVILKFLD